MIYGYARISNPKQNIERQIRNIKASYPTAYIFQEAYTGTRIVGRKELDKLLKIVKAGDCIVFDSVSRMSRNAEEGYDLYKSLYEQGISLIFLKEPHINTEVYKESSNYTLQATGEEIADIYIEATNKVLLILAEKQIKIAFEQSQKEVDDLRQRTKEGMITAKLNGKQIGGEKGRTLHVKKKEPIQKIIIQYSKRFDGFNTDDEVIAIIKSKGYNISRHTYYKYKKELSETMYYSD